MTYHEIMRILIIAGEIIANYIMMKACMLNNSRRRRNRRY